MIGRFPHHLECSSYKIGRSGVHHVEAFSAQFPTPNHQTSKKRSVRHKKERERSNNAKNIIIIITSRRAHLGPHRPLICRIRKSLVMKWKQIRFVAFGSHFVDFAPLFPFPAKMRFHLFLFFDRES